MSTTTILSEQISYLEAELRALRHPKVAELAAVNPDCVIGVYASRIGTEWEKATVTLSCQLGIVDKSVPLEEVADFVAADGYRVAFYRKLHEEPGLLVRLYISAEKRFSADEKKLLKATNHLVTKRISQSAVVCGI
jgi:hypothetical protein